jgi:hypothetical protein
MNDWHTYPSLQPIWSALRYPGSGWVSEMLARQLNQAMARERNAGNHPEQPGRGRRIPGTIPIRSAVAPRPQGVCCAEGS